MADSIIRCSEHLNNFTLIDNTCMKTSTLSMQAMGLFAYLMTLPNDWAVYKSELVNHFSNGRDAVYKAFNELIDAGFITYVQNTDEAGRFTGNTYYIHEQPVSEKNRTVRPVRSKTNKSSDDTENCKSVSGNPHSGNPYTENPSLLSTNKPSTDNQNSKSHCCGSTATKRASKKSEKTFSNDDYSRVFSIYYTNCQILHEEGRLGNDVPVRPVLGHGLKGLIKKAFLDYGVENVINAVKESRNHDWLVKTAKYDFTVIFSEKELPKLINKTYSNEELKSKGFRKKSEPVDLSGKISLGELAYCDDECYENDYDLGKIALKVDD